MDGDLVLNGCQNVARITIILTLTMASNGNAANNLRKNTSKSDDSEMILEFR